MTVADLKILIKDLPDDMVVIYDLHSDYKVMELDEIRIKDFSAATIKDGWVRKWYPGMEDEGLTLSKALHFPGN